MVETAKMQAKLFDIVAVPVGKKIGYLMQRLHKIIYLIG